MTDVDDFTPLRDELQGELTCLGDDGWEIVRQPFNLAADQRPAAVVSAAGGPDIEATVAFARENDLRVALQATGHGALAMGDLAGSILLRTSRLSDVTVDPEARRATAGAGARWGAVTGACDPHRLAPLAGSSSTVSVAGYSLGGGVGFLGRRHGIQANRLTAVEMALADGRTVRASADEEPDLFWAVRGGGGSFGAAISLEFELVELPEFQAGALAWPWERSEEVAKRWLNWCGDAPEEISSGLRLIQFPPLEQIPEPVRGRRLVMIDAVYAGDADSARECLAGLRELAPEMDTWASHAPGALAVVHGDPAEPVPSAAAHCLLEEATPETIDAWVATAGPGSGSPLMFSELRHWGGAIAREPDGAGAVGVFSEQFSLFSIGVAPAPEVAATVEEHADRIAEAVSPWASPRSYLSFVEREATAEVGFDAATYARLQDVKRAVDPDDLFQSNHPVRT